MKKILKTVSYALGIFVILIAVLAILGIALAPDYTKKENPAGFKMNFSKYLTMEDDNKILIDIWLPEDLEEGETIPTILESTLYSDLVEVSPAYRLLQTYFGEPDLNYDSDEYKNIKQYLSKGYAFIFINDYASGGSTGTRDSIYMIDKEIEVFNTVIDYVIAQNWSNKKIAATGFSYSGTTSEIAILTGREEIKAVAPLHSDFRCYNIIRPGGIMTDFFIEKWQNMTSAMERDDIAAVVGIEENRVLTEEEASELKTLVTGNKGPTDKNDLDIYHEVLQSRNNIDVYKAALDFNFNDSLFGSKTGDEMSLYTYKDQLNKSNTFGFYRTGWFDGANVEENLIRFQTLDTPQVLVIGPWGHGNEYTVDPYAQTVDNESKDTDMEEYFKYLDMAIKDDETITNSQIKYYTLGENRWKTTDVWPPAGTEYQTYYFNKDNLLSADKPLQTTGSNTYTVDFEATTGENNRWLAPLGKFVKVEYANRAEEDKKLLTYTTLPVEQDTFITGTVNVTLNLISNFSDGTFHVYLEDINQDGSVSYLTEGVLRVIHRSVGNAEHAPFVPVGVYHTFESKDANPLEPGKIEEIRMSLQPISVLIKKGHSIRIAIAGYDKGTTRTNYYDIATPEMEVQINSIKPSSVDLPIIK